MSATDVVFGISRHAGALIDSVETTKKVDKAELRGSKGVIKVVKDYNLTISGNVKGHGTLTVVPGVGESEVDGVEGAGGVTIIDEVKDTEGNTDFSGWEYSFTHYPEAEEVEVEEEEGGGGV